MIFRRLVKPSLSLKIALLLIVILSLVAILAAWRSEVVLEKAMLEQTHRQAELYLKLLEEKILSDGSPRDKWFVQRLLENEFTGLDHLRTFSIEGIYIYDIDGNVYAEAGEDTVPTRDMSSYYGDVIRRDASYLGDEAEKSEGDGEVVSDIIIPLHQEGRVVGAIEMDLNLSKTVDIVSQINRQYEWELFWIVGSASLITLLLIGYLARRTLLVPIKELNEVTRRISAGELQARINWKSSDELGKLAESINGMAWSIDYLFEEQERSYLQMLQTLEKALEAKDAYTAVHSTRVARYAVMLGRSIGLSREELRQLKQGALVHDLGKIGIADSILNKAGRLSDAEYEVMRSHPELTATIMQPLRHFKAFVEIAKSHHERWDGTGYPEGLAGEAIPLLARIVSIADSWDAMTGNRIYRPGMSVEKALWIMEQERYSGQWDPELLGLFIAMVRDKQQAYHAVESEHFYAGLNTFDDQLLPKEG